MSESILLSPEVQMLTAAVVADPAEVTTQCALRDAAAEVTGDPADGDAAVARAIALVKARHEAERVAAEAAKLAAAVEECAGDRVAAARLVEARAMVEGTIRVVPSRRHPWRTTKRRDAKAARLRGMLCRTAGATARHNNRPISCTEFVVVPGDAAPTYEGRSWYYTTATGVVVRHPNAYKRVAKSATLVYHAASHVVTVGAGWVLAHAALATA